MNTIRIASAAVPNMDPKQVYCMNCDDDRLTARIDHDHVSKRFMSNDEIRHTDIYLHGEQVLHAYEALDGQWAIVSAHEPIKPCPRCTQSTLVRLDFGPYEVRRTA